MKTRTLGVAVAIAAIAALLASAQWLENRGGSVAEDETGAPERLMYPISRGTVPAWLTKVRPEPRGRWVSAVRSPDGRTLLAQWLAECEIPLTYFVSTDSRRPRPVAPGRYGAVVETVAVGWSDDGRAGVVFLGGACGAGDPRPGLYLVALDGRRQFVTAEIAEIERWQAARS